jgi:peptidoglycan/LPS O-acetylase OafA/YrhL
MLHGAVDAPPAVGHDTSAGQAPASGEAPAGGRTAVKAGRPRARLAWLDALRGFAALCVVFDHATYHVLEPARNWVYQWFDPGQYGVFVFFLVSGYIIPASLERKGSVRGFWISRVFRLYPLYLIALAASVVGAANGWGTIHGAQHHPLTAAASWLLMMPNVLSGPNVPNVTWTLAYEMVFYLVVAALFSWRAHKPSGGYALGLAGGAVALGGILPMWSLYHAAGGRADAYGGGHVWLLDAAADALIIGGVVVAVAASRRANPLPARIGASVAAVTAVVLVNVNAEYPYPWSGCVILALMFAGTLIYRAEQGQVGKAKATAILLGVLMLSLAAGLWHGDTYGTSWLWQWVTSLLGAAVTFAIGMALRHHRVPAPLAWLGLVSYSVYLLHPLVVDAYTHLSLHLSGVSMGVQAIIALGIVATVLLVSAASYYVVEKPMQKAGRWLTAHTTG